MKVENIADIINKLRIVPRLLMLGYGFIFYEITHWFMNIPDPTAPQSAFVATVVGSAAAFFGLYVGSGNKK